MPSIGRALNTKISGKIGAKLVREKYFTKNTSMQAPPLRFTARFRLASGSHRLRPMLGEDFVQKMPILIEIVE